MAMARSVWLFNGNWWTTLNFKWEYFMSIN